MAMEIDAIEAELEGAENKQQSQPAQPETPAETRTTEKEAPVEPEIREQSSENAQDIEYWKKKALEAEKEAEIAEKRRRDSESHLTPVQQEAAKLRKENSALEDKIQELSAKLDSLAGTISKSKNFAPESDILDTDFPDVAEGLNNRLARLKQELKEEAIREAREAILKDTVSRDDFKSLKSRLEEEADAAEARRHFLDVKSLHDDAGAFFDKDALRPAFAEWAKTQSPEYENVVNFPRSFTPRFVASVIAQFKKDVGMVREAAKPSLGDRVARATPAPNVTPDKPKEAEEFLSDEQLNGFDELQRKYRNDPLMQGKLIEMLERTMKRNMQRR